MGWGGFAPTIAPAWQKDSAQRQAMVEAVTVALGGRQVARLLTGEEVRGLARTAVLSHEEYLTEHIEDLADLVARAGRCMVIRDVAAPDTTTTNERQD